MQTKKDEYVLELDVIDEKRRMQPTAAGVESLTGVRFRRLFMLESAKLNEMALKISFYPHNPPSARRISPFKLARLSPLRFLFQFSKNL